MGWRIKNYTRDELRKVALPGHAISTLFWVLPIGRWRAGELDRWWDFFTREQGRCHHLGLLLVRDLARNDDDTDSANLASPLSAAEGGRLLDLVPELEDAFDRWNASTKPEVPALLVLSGAYPQPGWGVLIPRSDGGLRDAYVFEDLVEKAISQSCDHDALLAIRNATHAHHARKSAHVRRPQEPREPAHYQDVLKARDSLQGLLRALDTGNSREMHRALSLLRTIHFEQLLPSEYVLSSQQWSEIHGAISLPREMNALLKEGELILPDILANYDACFETERSKFLDAASPKDKAFIRKFLFLRDRHPALQVHGLCQWLETEYPTHLKNQLHVTLAGFKAALETRAAEVGIEMQKERQQFEADRKGWTDNLKEAEQAFRSSLVDATTAQWNFGPRFLMALEKVASELGLPARSIPWDAPRMIGWKLNLAVPHIQGMALLVAVKSVLPAASAHKDADVAPAAFSGSLFADFAYYVAMSAHRLSPWQATRQLLIELLGAGELLSLVHPSRQPNVGGWDKEQLATELLDQWGWKSHAPEAPSPLAGCIGITPSKPAILTKSLNETRISLEGCLQDLVRVATSSLGWHEPDLETQISVHCPSFRRSPGKSWSEEFDKLTSGGALVLLTALLPLAFPKELTKDQTESLCSKAKRVLRQLNIGSHYPPPPPPTDGERSEYATAIVEVLDIINTLVGEMPWHFRPTQIFGSEPAIATGHAWSHSHPEERLIRVMLWAGTRPKSQMLVWNPSKANPVMTDAVVL